MDRCDEIAELARRYLDAPERVEAQIALAKGDARWDDMNKWHRVRLRMIRLSRAG